MAIENASTTITCPTAEALVALARRVWEFPRATVHPQCVQIRADEPLWFITGTAREVAADGRMDWYYPTAIVTPGGQVRSLEPGSGGEPGEGADRYTAVDLDGDRRDEIVVERTVYFGADHRDGWRELAVISIGADGQVVQPDPSSSSHESKPLSLARYQVYRCDSTHRFVDSASGGSLIEITGHPVVSEFPGVFQAWEEGCPLLGPHLYVWNGQQLIESP